MTANLTTRTDAELRQMFEAATRTSYNASDVEAIVAELDRRRPKCETRTGTDRCTEDATYVVVRAAIPATTYFPAAEAIRSAQCSRHAAMWTRTDRKGRPVHPTMTVEPLF